MKGPGVSSSHTRTGSSCLPPKLNSLEAPVGCCEIARARVRNHDMPAGSNYPVPGAVTVLALQSVPEGTAPADGVMIPPSIWCCQPHAHIARRNSPPASLTTALLEPNVSANICMVLLLEGRRVHDRLCWPAGARCDQYHDPSLWSTTASGPSGHMSSLPSLLLGDWSITGRRSAVTGE